MTRTPKNWQGGRNLLEKLHIEGNHPVNQFLHSDGRMQMLINLARPLVGEIILSRPDMSAATVAAAILSHDGRTYTGVCIHVSCGIGFCAEHAALAEMLKGRETQIQAIVAVNEDGVLSPCGRCRELMVQVDRRNLDATIGLPGDRTATLRELLPCHWLEPLPSDS